MTILTEAEKIARYDAARLSRSDYTPLSPAWEALLDITDDPMNDGRAHDDDALTSLLTDLYGSDDADDALTPDEEIVLDLILTRQDEAEDDREHVPVPPVPVGYPTDKAFLHKWYGETFVTIDRRDGEMVICHRGEMGGTILTPAFAAALYQFFWNDAIIELMEYHRKKADPDEQPTPPIIVDILETIEAHFDQKGAPA